MAAPNDPSTQNDNGSKRIMEDDTVDLLGDDREGKLTMQQNQLSRAVDRILNTHSQETRAHAIRWSQSLRFLTFDDGIDSSKPPEPSASDETDHRTIKGQCVPCQNRKPIPSGHVCASHFTFTPRQYENRDTELSKYRDPCVHVAEHSCKICQHIPLFPNEGKVTRFRIRRIHRKDWDWPCNCDHYVAVSYCWASTPKETDKSKAALYQVIDEDDEEQTPHPMLAAPSTIDRAVNFARENGFRMIWIDQECIRQDGKEDAKEKEKALQAMDYVYVRARASIGLFQTELQQKHLEALLLTFEAKMGAAFPLKRRGRSPFSGCRQVDLNDIKDAISIIANDRWNTRAWVLQEAFASSQNMTILFPRSSSIDIRGWVLVCHERSQSEVAVLLDIIRKCLEVCMPMVWPKFIKELTVKNAKKAGVGKSTEAESSTARNGSEEAATPDPRLTMERLRLFHPDRPDEQWNFWVMHDKPRRTCNAAVAITYLKLRQLLHVSDKLAIMANMCGYDLRLNTEELGQTEKSLASCMLVLALINGDFSLLVPEVYRGVRTKPPCFPSSINSEFSWAHDLSQNLRLVESNSWDPQGQWASKDSAAFVKLSSKGLECPGTAWVRESFLDMTHLQVKYADSWKKLRSARGPVSSPSPKTVLLAHTHLLFEIIQAAISVGQTEFATSILNATSDWRWRNRPGETSHKFIETIDEFPSDLAVENRRGMFALDADGDGGYHQSWIIDRLMDEGGLWVWCWPRETIEEYETWAAQKDDEVEAEKQEGCALEAVTEGSHFSNEEICSDGGESPPGPNATYRSSIRNAEEPARIDSHAKAMSTLRMFQLQSSSIFDLTPEDREGEKDQTLNTRSYLFSRGVSMGIFAMGISGFSKEQAARRSAFDVGPEWGDNPMVVTPFRISLESVPRSAMRSMSVSWIVERVEASQMPEGGRDSGTPQIRVKGMVKGMWKFDARGRGRFQIV